MMAIYDQLLMGANAPLLKFVGDNTVNEIHFQVAPLSQEVFYNGNAQSYFEDGDNILIEKIRMFLPYQYGAGNHAGSPFRIGLSWVQGGGAIDIPELGTYGLVNLNGLCTELSPNIQCSAPNPGSGRFQLVLSYADLNISQINAPTALNGVDLFLNTHIEVRHTLPMRVAP